MVTTRSGQDADEQSPRRTAGGSRARKLARKPEADSDSEDDDDREEEEVAKKASPTNKKGGGRKNTGGKVAQQNSSSGSSWSFKLVGLVILAVLVWYFLISDSGGVGKKTAVNSDSRALVALRSKRKEQLEALMIANFEEQEIVVAKKLVAEVLLRNERQLQAGTEERSTVFHFGGGSADSYRRMEKVVEEFMFSPATPQATLRVAAHKGELDGIRNKIYDQLIQTPRSLIILERADEVKESSLTLIEDAFENAVFVHGGKGVGCTQAVFIIETSLGEGMAETVCGGKGACDLTHKDALVRHLKQASQAIWTRQALVARIRDVVPFA